MSMPLVDANIVATAWLLGKVSVLLAAAAMTNALLHRRSSAATRHLVWTLTVVGLLLLPMLSALFPGWTVARLTPASPLLMSRDVSALAVVSPARSVRAAGRAISIPWSTTIPALYAAGVLILLARLIAEQVAMQRLATRATEITQPELTRLLLECARCMGVRRPVRMLWSGEHSMPMVFGTRVPAIVLPTVADAWSQDRRRAVLLHELAHVARYDCLTQMAAAVACAVYWIHPGVWWIARRLRMERELACDDRVLTAGTTAREYAGHLLELAYSLGGHRAPALAVSMARPRQLEGRMLAVLDPARNRSTPAIRSRLAGIAIMAALLVPLAGAEATAVPPSADSPTLVQLTGALDEGPTIMIRSIEFVGNQGISSGVLKQQMKSNKEGSIWRRIFGGRRPYQAAKFSEDADQIVRYYRDHGYITARVGTPELTLVHDSADKHTRFVDLRIPVAEGHRYTIGEFTFVGNAFIRNDALRMMFKVERGTYYSETTIRRGLEKAREAYGAGGYFEFTGYPDFRLRDLSNPGEPDTPEALKAEATKPPTGPSIVDITVRLQEGKQFFVNRLTLTGITRESLVRREVRLVDGGVFNTEALKDSIKRLNKLGYFKRVEGKDVDISKTPGEDNKVDVTLKLEDR